MLHRRRAQRSQLTGKITDGGNVNGQEPTAGAPNRNDGGNAPFFFGGAGAGPAPPKHGRAHTAQDSIGAGPGSPRKQPFNHDIPPAPRTHTADTAGGTAGVGSGPYNFGARSATDELPRFGRRAAPTSDAEREERQQRLMQLQAAYLEQEEKKRLEKLRRKQEDKEEDERWRREHERMLAEQRQREQQRQQHGGDAGGAGQQGGGAVVNSFEPTPVAEQEEAWRAKKKVDPNNPTTIPKMDAQSFLKEAEEQRALAMARKQKEKEQEALKDKLFEERIARQQQELLHRKSPSFTNPHPPPPQQQQQQQQRHGGNQRQNDAPDTSHGGEGHYGLQGPPMPTGPPPPLGGRGDKAGVGMKGGPLQQSVESLNKSTDDLNIDDKQFAAEFSAMKDEIQKVVEEQSAELQYLRRKLREQEEREKEGNQRGNRSNHVYAPMMFDNAQSSRVGAMGANVRKPMYSRFNDMEDYSSRRPMYPSHLGAAGGGDALQDPNSVLEKFLSDDPIARAGRNTGGAPSYSMPPPNDVRQPRQDRVSLEKFAGVPAGLNIPLSRPRAEILRESTQFVDGTPTPGGTPQRAPGMGLFGVHSPQSYDSSGFVRSSMNALDADTTFVPVEEVEPSGGAEHHHAPVSTAQPAPSAAPQPPPVATGAEVDAANAEESQQPPATMELRDSHDLVVTDSRRGSKHDKTKYESQDSAPNQEAEQQRPQEEPPVGEGQQAEATTAGGTTGVGLNAAPVDESYASDFEHPTEQ